MRAVAQFLSAHRRPGDAINYPQPSITPWYLSYPYGLGQLRNIGLAQSPGAAGRLNANSVPLPVLQRREQRGPRIWGGQVGGNRNPAAHLGPGLPPPQGGKLARVPMVWLYTKPG